MTLLDRLRRRRLGMRMNCAAVGEVLQQHLDGELDDGPSTIVEAHLDMCRRCGLEASIYADIKAALAEQGRLPEESVQRLRDFGERIAQGAPDDGR